MKASLELVVLPVRDVDVAKEFYVEKMGFALDVDHRAGESFRVVQMTPPGSACSVAVGTGLSDAAPGSVRGLHLVVEDLEATCAELTGRGVELSAPRHMTGEGWKDGVDPAHADYASYAFFADPDGNTWELQERGHAAAGGAAAG